MTINIQTVPGSLSNPPAETSVALVAAQDAPTLATDGVDVAKYSEVGVQVHDLDTITSYSVEPWVYFAATGEWTQVKDATGADVSYTLANSGFVESFAVAPFDRFMLRLSAITGTSVKITHRAAGPGL